MGNIFCPPGTEPLRPSAVVVNDSVSDQLLPSSQEISQQPVEDVLVKVTAAQEQENFQKIQKEQARLELIVSSAGRDMVSVKTNRASHYYNDQGFAAALSQHLQQTLPESSAAEAVIPPVEMEEAEVLSILTRPIPSDSGVDHRMEQFVSEQLSVTKEQLFAGCQPIVENLL